MLKKRVALTADAFLLRATLMSKIGKNKKVDPNAEPSPKESKANPPKDMKPKPPKRKTQETAEGGGETDTKKTKKGEKAVNKEKEDIIKALTEMKEDEGDGEEDDDDLEE